MTLSLTYKGFNYPAYYNGAYENADSLPSLAATGANSVALDLDYGINVNNSTVYADQNYTDSLTALGDTIGQATADGLSVMVRPLIDFLEPSLIGSYSVGDWRSFYDPKNVASFFSSYESMIVAEAKVAQANGATSFCIGAELDQLTGPQYLSYWTNIISAVRAVFSGKLTYSADWDDAISPWAGEHGLPAGTGNLATQVSFWNQLDYIGIDGYAPISDAVNPTLTQLIDGWTQVPTDPTSLAVTGNQSLISYFQNLSAELGKPLLFTELGYESATDAASQPSGSSTNVFDPSLQAELYQAFFDAWGQDGNGSLAGVYFWNWDPNAGEVGPGNGANFSPQGLPAQTVVSNNFTTAPALTHDTTAGAPVGSTVTIPASRLQADDNLSSHAQETYTVTSGPRDGTLLLNGTPTTSFTQAEVDAGQVSYHETGLGATSDSFTFSVSDAAGNATPGSFQILIPPPHNDLNGDGASDLLWANSATGDTGWNDGVDTPWHDLNNTQTNYEVVATANFNGGEHADLLWWNPYTGDTGWNDGVNTAWHDIGTAPTSYKIVGAADYNGDGSPDLLWTNSATRDIGWNDGADTTWHDLGSVMSGYQVAGSGDLTGGGTADIILSNSTTGDITYWLMNAGAVQNSVDLGDVPSGYQTAGLGDFLGNGIDEILLHNPATGDTGYWQLNGGSGVTFDDLGTMNTGYQVASVGQYAGNGTDGILWTNPTTGDTGYWKMAGGTVPSFVDLGSTGNSGYHIVT